MIRIVRARLIAVGAVAALAATTGAAIAIFDEPAPKPKVDCSKKANKDHPACTRNNTDEIYNAAYWLAKSGKYAEARALLLGAGDASDPRILNALGLTTRKLGDVDAALAYYARAIALNPDYTLARAYRGEAYLQKGDVASAKAELGEIKTRRGAACQEYAELAGHIDRYEQSQSRGG